MGCVCELVCELLFRQGEPRLLVHGYAAVGGKHRVVLGFDEQISMVVIKVHDRRGGVGRGVHS